jgi:hypothetical protein
VGTWLPEPIAANNVKLYALLDNISQEAYDVVEIMILWDV